jgi:hypothetical protein
VAALGLRVGWRSLQDPARRRLPDGGPEALALTSATLEFGHSATDHDVNNGVRC